VPRTPARGDGRGGGDTSGGEGDGRRGTASRRRPVVVVVVVADIVAGRSQQRQRGLTDSQLGCIDGFPPASPASLPIVVPSAVHLSAQILRRFGTFFLGRIAVLRIDAACCYSRSSVVCPSVGLSVWLSDMSSAETADAVWVEDSGGPKEPC